MNADADTLPNEDWREIREPCTGPRTGDVLTALDVLEETAARQQRQQAVTATRAFPEYDGLPYTGELEQLPAGDQMKALGTIDRAGLEHAAEAMAPDRGRHRVARERQAGGRTLRVPACWPLLAVLAVQAVLSLRLVWSNTAFQDEALYLWAGHLEWQYWLHGAPVPDFATYFSGAPVVYPPLAALADSLGGLAGARLLSLAFMLGATSLLWAMTTRLYGRRPAFFAAALFGGVAATQYLGAFATYDAMALFLLSLSAWLAVRSCGRLSEPLLAAAAMSMALADSAKYAAALWNPVIIVLVALTAESGGGLRRAFRAARVAAYVAAALLLALHAGGHPYIQGILTTTVARAAAQNSVIGVLSVSVGWVGSVGFLAVIGTSVIFCRFPDRRNRLTGLVLAGAIALAPAEQARIHTIISLFKHVGFGAWFACAVAGYGVAALATVVPAVKERAALRAGGAAAAASAVIGVLLATTHYQVWPDAARFTAVLGPVLRDIKGPVVASEDTYIVQYYLGADASSHTFASPGYFAYTDPVTRRRLNGDPAYAAAVRNRYFAVIALPFWAEQATDTAIGSDIARWGGYRLAARIPYTAAGARSSYRIWVREGAK